MNGVSGWERVVVDSTQTVNGNGGQVAFTAGCPAGKKPVGGGHEANGAGGGSMVLVASHPHEVAATGFSGWRVMLRNNTAGALSTTVKVHVVCATVQ